MPSSTQDETPHDDEFRLWREGDWWIARDVNTGVTTQRPSREEALRTLDGAVTLHEGGVGYEPTDEELRAVGIDSKHDTTGGVEPPDVQN